MSVYDSISSSYGSGWKNNQALVHDVSRVAGIDPSILYHLGGAESGWQNIKNRHAGQSAAGLFQITNGTFKGWLNKYGKQLGIPMNTNQYDPKANALLTAMAVKDYAKNIESTGRKVTGADIYANHFLGEGGYRDLARALATNPNAPVSSFLSPKTISVNKPYTMVNGRVATAQEMYNILGKKMVNASVPSGNVDVNLNKITHVRPPNVSWQEFSQRPLSPLQVSEIATQSPPKLQDIDPFNYKLGSTSFGNFSQLYNFKGLF